MNWTGGIWSGAGAIVIEDGLVSTTPFDADATPFITAG
jgi:hypothetical protein